MPQPMASKIGPSPPSGITANASTPAGMIHSAVNGTASRLAKTPTTDTAWKW